MVRSIDLARHMGYSKPSVSRAVSILRDGGFLTIDKDSFLYLTDVGREIAEKIYERHQFFTAHLIEMGVDPVQAEQDACRIEHVISEESYQVLKKAIESLSTGYAASPCPMLENPECLRAMVKRTGAKSTDLQSPESADHLCDKCRAMRPAGSEPLTNCGVSAKKHLTES